MIIILIMWGEALFGWWLKPYNRVCSVMEFMLDQLVTGAAEKALMHVHVRTPQTTWGFNHLKSPTLPPHARPIQRKKAVTYALNRSSLGPTSVLSSPYLTLIMTLQLVPFLFFTLPFFKIYPPLFFFSFIFLTTTK